MIRSIYFICNGETEWTASKCHSGRTDIPLTAKGEDRVQACAKHLSEITFDHVLTSPLQRAQRTCELVGLTKISEVEPDLTEWDYGDYEGLRAEDICKTRPGWNLFRDGPPNGETPDQISARADRCIVRLRGLEGNIALFSHGHLGRVLAARWIGLPVAKAHHLLLSPASISVLAYENERSDQPVIALWNVIAPESLVPLTDAATGVDSGLKRNTIDRWENEGGEIPKIADSTAPTQRKVNDLPEHIAPSPA